jgi:transcriptional regulator with XRE-family HTH domain
MIAGIQFDPLSQEELRDDYFVALYGAHDSMTSAYNLRAQQGWNQKAISIRLNCDESLVSRRLNGEENMTLRTMSGMASAMNCRLTITFTPYEQCGVGSNFFFNVFDQDYSNRRIVPNKQNIPNPPPQMAA